MNEADLLSPSKSEVTSENKTKASRREKQPGIPRGRPKSGKIWKAPKAKFSSIIKVRGIKNSFESKRKLQEKLSRVKEASKAIKAAKQEEKELKKQRRRENIKRQEENRKKSEVVQVITNTKKLKKMKKKQLRYIEKRDTTVVSK